MKKLMAAVLLITGTSIGGGMIILPAIIGIYGYVSALGILIFTWLFNTVLALIFLEANCYLPCETSLISMSKKLLGPYTGALAWGICLSFLYTLLCVYLVGITEIMGNFLSLPVFYLPFIIVLALSVPIYLGMHYLNHCNYLVVISMFLIFFMIVIFISPHIAISQVLYSSNRLPLMALPIVFTSFGFLIVIPSLRTYLQDDIKKLKQAIILGSAIPLLIYILWTTLIMAIIPAEGISSLHGILTAAQPVKSMTETLNGQVNNEWLSGFIQVFILLAMLSSFVGIALGLYDFLADGLRINKTAIGKAKLLVLTFLPPLIVTLSQTQLFLLALGFAGLTSTILFGIYPVILAWSGRYIHKLPSPYRVAINQPVFLLMIIGALLIIGAEFLALKQHFHN